MFAAAKGLVMLVEGRKGWWEVLKGSMCGGLENLTIHLRKLGLKGKLRMHGLQDEDMVLGRRGWRQVGLCEGWCRI
jgi:hypothetical protein